MSVQVGDGWVEGRGAPQAWGYAVWTKHGVKSVQHGAYAALRQRVAPAQHELRLRIHDGGFWSYGGIPRRLPNRSDEGPWVKMGR